LLLASLAIGCAVVSECGFSDSWRDCILKHLDACGDGRVAAETADFIRRKELKLEIENREITSLTRAEFDGARRAVVMRGAFERSRDGSVSADRLAVAASVAVHEVKHARDRDAGVTVLCWEGEVLASLEQAMFERVRAEKNGGKRLRALDRRFAESECERWWECPLPLAAARKIAIKELWQENALSDRIAEWLRIRVLASGVDAFFRYHDGIVSLEPGDGFLPSIDEKPNRVIGVLEEAEWRWRRHCGAASKSAGCDRERRLWSEQMEIWKSPGALSVQKNRIRKAMEEARVKAREFYADAAPGT
jgi:hypothetical protein